MRSKNAYVWYSCDEMAFKDTNHDQADLQQTKMTKSSPYKEDWKIILELWI